MDRQTLEHELARLEKTHKSLDEKIKRGYTNYIGDSCLGKMKQEKLAVKRQIEESKTKLKTL
jgi:hypothetical protein